MYYVCARLAVKQRSAGLERRGGLGAEGRKEGRGHAETPSRGLR